jgi:hypothetical protein
LRNLYADFGFYRLPEDLEMDHAVSVNMKSKDHVKHVYLSDESQERVLFEGSLGELEEVTLIEDAVLEVVGVNGVLRLDLSRDELAEVLQRRKEVRE